MDMKLLVKRPKTAAFCDVLFALKFRLTENGC